MTENDKNIGFKIIDNFKIKDADYVRLQNALIEMLSYEDKFIKGYRTKEEIEELITKNRQEFNLLKPSLKKHFNNDVFLLKNHELKFNIFLEAVRSILLEIIEEEDYVIDEEIIRNIITKEEYDEIYKRALAYSQPGKASLQKFTETYGETFKKTNTDLEKLIKGWVPFRFRYYKTYHDAPDEIESFKDAINEYILEKEAENASFERMVYDLVSLLQISSIDPQIKKRIMKQLNIIGTDQFLIETQEEEKARKEEEEKARKAEEEEARKDKGKKGVDTQTEGGRPIKRRKLGGKISDYNSKLLPYFDDFELDLLDKVGFDINKIIKKIENVVENIYRKGKINRGIFGELTKQTATIIRGREEDEEDDIVDTITNKEIKNTVKQLGIQVNGILDASKELKLSNVEEGVKKSIIKLLQKLQFLLKELSYNDDLKQELVIELARLMGESDLLEWESDITKNRRAIMKRVPSWRKASPAPVPAPAPSPAQAVAREAENLEAEAEARERREAAAQAEAPAPPARPAPAPGNSEENNLASILAEYRQSIQKEAADAREAGAELKIAARRAAEAEQLQARLEAQKRAERQRKEEAEKEQKNLIAAQKRTQEQKREEAQARGRVQTKQGTSPRGRRPPWISAGYSNKGGEGTIQFTPEEKNELLKILTKEEATNLLAELESISPEEINKILEELESEISPTNTQEEYDPELQAELEAELKEIEREENKGGRKKKGGKSTKRRRGGKELTEEEITDLLNVENIDKDIADVLEINKKFGILRERLQDLSGNWESYKSTYPIKEFKDLQPKELINTLSEIDINFTFNKLDDSEIKSLKETIDEGVKKLSDVADQKERYPLEKNIQALTSELKEKTKIFNEEKSKQDSLKKIFNPTFNKLIPLLSNISTFTTQDIEKYSELANKLKGVYEEQPAQPQKETQTAGQQQEPQPQDGPQETGQSGQSRGGYTKEDISTANEYINEISRKYGEIEGYSKEDLEAIYKTLSTDLNTTKEEIKTEITEIRDEIKEIMKDMSGYGEKYADINIQIKQNVYKLLEEQDEKLKILIVEKLNSLERELLGEIEIYYKNIKKNAIASGIPEIDLNPRTDSYSSESPYGSLYEKERIEFKGDRETEFDEDNDDDEYKGGADEDTFLSKIKEKRAIIDELFEESIEVEMKKLQSLIDVFITNVKRVKDPSYLLTLNGQDSIFNKIFNKYLEDRQNADKGEYVASNELVEGIKSNKVLPREILKIDFRDKAIFIFVTMFIRLISLSIVNLLIDRGNVKSLASTIIAFLTAYSVLFIVFVLIVNIDTYKLRIIFNYVNMHINSSILFTYPIIVWLFGAAIYYIMMNVNEGETITASSDEDRLRLQYKLETLSMILWVFVSILILVF